MSEMCSSLCLSFNKITQSASLMSLFNIYIEHFNLLREGKKENQNQNSSGQIPPSGRQAGIQCWLCVDQTCRAIGGANEGLGRGRALSLGTGTGPAA